MPKVKRKSTGRPPPPRRRRAKNTPSTQEPGCTIENLPAYDYEALDHSAPQFRIFTLEPAEDRDSPLRGVLRIENFSPTSEGQQSYEAVSYVWGAQPKAWPLFVAGATLPLSSNLAQALRYIRHSSQPRQLWIDALCINQSSSREKNHQVRQMYQIFAQATRVLIWLGESDEDSEYALTHLEGLTGALRLDIPRIAKLFTRPWWSRVWTFQEGLAASGDSLVLCGQRTVAWQTVLQALGDLLKCARRYPDAALHRFRYFLEVNRLRRSAQEVHLDRLVFASSYREATDPRDYVYALLGLVNDMSYESIDLDYSKSVSWAFQQAMVSMIRSRKDLDILVSKLMLKRTTKISWCIQFSITEDLQQVDTLHLHRRFGTTDDGATTGRRFQWIKHNPYKGRIKLPGTIVGRIGFSTMCEKYDKSCNLSENEVKFLRFMRIKTLWAKWIWKTRLDSSQASAKVAAGDIWRVIANGQHIEYILDEAPVLEDIYAALAVLSQLELDLIDQLVAWVDIATGEPTEMSKYMQRYEDKCGQVQKYNTKLQEELQSMFMGHVCLNAKALMGTPFEKVWRTLCGFAKICSQEVAIFSTDTRYIGSGSADIRRGDHVCILFGSKLPLVLRPSTEGTYRIIDAVYVDGIMGGEFLRDESGYKVTNFVVE
jgi:hypothetical protein